MAKGSSGLGESLGKGSGGSVNIISETDVWTYRHNSDNADFVDAINTSVSIMQNDYKDIMQTVNQVFAAELGGADKVSTLGYWDPSSKTLALNQEYTDIDKMNQVYDAAVKSGYHPSRGNKTGTEAVAFHEMGHALTDHIAKKMGVADLDAASQKIVDAAYKAMKGTGGTKAWAGKISGYAQESYAECVAEAVADHYCNGDKACAQSKAIIKQLQKYK